MKKHLRLTLAVILILAITMSLSSCYLINASNRNEIGEGATINVNGGDNYTVNITPNEANGVAAASKALMSAVSIYASFQKTQSSVWGSGSTVSAVSAGSGVIIDIDKDKGEAYILTNYHVVYDSESKTSNGISNDITVYLYGMEAAEYGIKATYVGGSMNYDLAVLKVEGSLVLMKSSAAAAVFGNSDNVAIYEDAIAVGNPEGKGISVTGGKINVDSEYINIYMSDTDSQSLVSLRVMRIDTPVNSGNSGGGLYNSKGELIGIVNAKKVSGSDGSSDVDGIGYAIPSNLAKSIADNIIFYCDGTDKECVYRAMLGITLGYTNMRTEYDDERGVLIKKEDVGVSEISLTSVALGKLKVNDRFLSITVAGETYEIYRTFHLIERMIDARVGDTVTFKILRDGNEMDISITVTADLLTPYE